MDPTCEKLNEKQRQEMMLVDKDNYSWIDSEEQFCSEKRFAGKAAVRFA